MKVNVTDYVIPGKAPVYCRREDRYSWIVTHGKWLEEHYDDEETAIERASAQARVEMVPVIVEDANTNLF